MNKVMIIGRLTKDVEIYYSENDNNTVFARYTLAINRTYKGNEKADFIRCIAFGKTAELAERYLSKGMKIAVEGRLHTGSYTTRDGRKAYYTDVAVDRQEFMEKRSDNSQPSPTPYTTDNFMNIPDGIDEELPFN